MFMGLCAVMLAQRGSTSPARTYGWHRAEVFTAVANAVLLIGVATFILHEAIGRIGQAPDVPGIPMVVVALTGLATNVAVALLLRSHSTQSLAVKGAYMEVDRRHRRQHRCADRRCRHDHHALALRRRGGCRPGRAMGAAPGISLAAGALRILSESSPSHIDVEDLRAALAAVDGVTEVHDLHVWTLCPARTWCTAHLTSCRRLCAGTERRARHPRRPRPRARHHPDRVARAAARWASSRATGKPAANSGRGPRGPPGRNRRADPDTAPAHRSRRWRRPPAPAPPRSAGNRDSAHAHTAPGQSLSSRCGATGPGPRW